MLWSKCLVVWTYAVTPSLIKGSWLVVVVGEGVFLNNMHFFDEVHKKRRLILFARGSHLCSYHKYSVSSFYKGIIYQKHCSFILYIYYSLARSLIMTLRTMLCFSYNFISCTRTCCISFNAHYILPLWATVLLKHPYSHYSILHLHTTLHVFITLNYCVGFLLIIGLTV